MSGTESRLPELVAPSELEPGVSRLWQRFAEITTIPRPSGGEENMIHYVREFATERGLDFEQDRTGNVLVVVPATPGYEERPGVIIQAHMDMVCVPKGNDGPAVHAVLPVLDESGEWVRAEGTTLGADNGIGFAMALSLVDEDLPHGPLKLLATVDEEVGLTGTQNLGFSRIDVSGDRFLINLDTEDDDELTIGCGGGVNTRITLPVEKVPLGDRKLLRISVGNLLGGHSGVVIGQNRKNAIKVLAASLGGITQELKGSVQLVSLTGGDARNAIPRSAEA